MCYLQDPYSEPAEPAEPAERGQGVGRTLIEAVVAQARLGGARRVHWQAQATHAAGRALYGRVARHAGFIVYGHDLPQ